MPDAVDQSDHLLSPEEVADLLEVDASTVRRWIVAGHLPAIRLPGLRPRYRVRHEDARALGAQPVKPA